MNKGKKDLSTVIKRNNEKKLIKKREWEELKEVWKKIEEEEQKKHDLVRLVLEKSSKCENELVELLRKNILIADKGKKMFGNLDSDINLFYKMDNDVYLIVNAVISGPFVYVYSKDVFKINSYDEFKNLKFEDIYELLSKTRKVENDRVDKEKNFGLLITSFSS